MPVGSRRGASGRAGILLVDKPPGVTSHDVIARVRRALGEGRVGHAGTLDPAATGLLVVLVGPATRLASHLTAHHKTYVADICFGAETDTDDADGRVTCTRPVPSEASDPFAAAAIVASLVGEHEQVPPAYSAIKKDGIPAYKAARAGEAPALSPRTVSVGDARLLGIDLEPDTVWHVVVTVSKGTYVRAIARDVGRALSSAAHLCGLRRTASGLLTVDDAHTLEDIEEAAPDSDRLDALFSDPVPAVGLPVITVDEDDAARVRNGMVLAPSAIERIAPDRPDGGETAVGQCVSVVHADDLLAVYRLADDALRPVVVLPGGVKRRTR